MEEKTWVTLKVSAGKNQTSKQNMVSRLCSARIIKLQSASTTELTCPSCAPICESLPAMQNRLLYVLQMTAV
jgi:hypothetical protein